MFVLIEERCQIRAIRFAVSQAYIGRVAHQQWYVACDNESNEQSIILKDLLFNPAAQSKADIIITTPEKWDSMSRKWKDKKLLLESIGLMLVDEIHLLDDPRGGVLEGLMTRYIIAKDSKKNPLRILALSATIPNVEDVAKWS